ncbi:MAG: PLP-dependent aminotransferase family protein [Acutalibacteraceae bacterium]
MKYSVDKSQAETAYSQIYDQLKSDIVSGAYSYGSKLPSKRLLAAETGVSVVPVEHAYAMLCDEGYIESRERSGYFVIYKESDFQVFSEAGFSPAVPKIHTHSANTLFPYSVLAKAMRKVILNYEDKLLVKSPNHGCPELRLALCAYLARSCGITVAPQQVIIGSGAEYLYSMIIQLLGRERTYALENPSYDKISRVYIANGVNYEMLKMGKDGIKSDELRKSQATVLHITPFNSFPSGVTATASKRREYILWAKERGGYIIEDNYESELTVSKKNEDTVFSLSHQGPVIYLNTFSKTIAPSIRVGYMVLPEEMLGEFESKLGFYSCTVPVFEQYVLAELIQSGSFERHINRVRRIKRKQAGI